MFMDFGICQAKHIERMTLTELKFLQLNERRRRRAVP